MLGVGCWMFGASRLPTRPFPRSPGSREPPASPTGGAGRARSSLGEDGPQVAFIAPSRLAPPFPVTSRLSSLACPMMPKR
jgi:hypothetical protein